ncbi:glycine betaine ABC transporter substrate-binding protein [Bacillus sp. JJ722]|uniref:glycine betaine ABC transporter substrate-binding protein n=1 Tax=Bacillus sp. JJ722 TaxID=3122973 RepID=UPI002FFD7965
MKFKKMKIFSILIGLSLLLTACNSGEKDSKSDSSNAKDVNLAYVEWDTEIASTHIIGKVLEDLGYNVTLTPLDNAIMWESISKGEADAMVAGWLPSTHAAQYEEYKDDVVHLGENLKGAKIGLVVPTYMKVDSIEDLKSEANKTITGIEPGAGIVASTETALKEYKNLASWNLSTSSSGAMTVALEQAIKNKEEIVVTGWSPHWKFASYDLKYLDDPKGIFGGEETINTFVRKGLKEDLPEVYSVLDNFSWTTEDLESVMLEIADGTDPEVAAENWISANEDKVAKWTENAK